jgi:hypothetical protein
VNYPLLSRDTITRLLPLIDERRVSLVARGIAKGATPQGFLQAYYRDELDDMATTGTTYRERRQGFIKRHMRPSVRLWETNGAPSRLHLALVSWAYSPQPQRLKSWIRSNGLKNRQYRRYLGSI